MIQLLKEDIITIFENIENSHVPFVVNWFSIDKYAEDIAKIINSVIENKTEIKGDVCECQE